MTLTPAQQTGWFNRLRAISNSAGTLTAKALHEGLDVLHAEVIALQITCDHQAAEIVCYERLVADQRARIEILTERLSDEQVNVMTPSLEERFLEHFFKLPTDLRDKFMSDVMIETTEVPT